MRVGAKNLILGSYSFFLSVCYIPVFYSGSTTVRQVYLALTTPILVWLFKPNKFTSLHLIGLIFLIWCSISLFWSFNLLDSIDSLIYWLILAYVFILGSKVENIAPIFIGLALGLSLNIFNLPTGLFVNQNVLAETSLLVIIGLIIYQQWWFIPILSINIIVPSSRGVFVAALITLLVWLWNKSKLASLGILISLFGISSVLYYFNYKLGSAIERLHLWNDTFNGVTFLGQGVGTYHSAYPYFAELIDTFKYRPKQAHNDYLQVLFELGLPGLMMMLGFIYLTMKINKNEKYILIAFLIMACFSFPLYMPVSAFIFAIVAGHMSRNLGDVFDTSNVGRVPNLSRI